MTILEAYGLGLPGRLFDVDIKLRPGELAFLVGPNGSGKTSLLHALAGIDHPGGKVTIDGIDPRAAAPAARTKLYSFLPASRDVRWPLTARDLIMLGGAGRDAVEDAVRSLELDTVINRKVDRLSTGERSRVLIARALAPNPRVLLLDEPTANLDPLWQIRLMRMLKTRLAVSGNAALVAIHDLDAAARYGDRMIVMNQGQIAADGYPGDVLVSRCIPDVFGIERADGEWRPAVSLPADRRSLR